MTIEEAILLISETITDAVGYGEDSIAEQQQALDLLNKFVEDNL